MAEGKWVKIKLDQAFLRTGQKKKSLNKYTY